MTFPWFSSLLSPLVYIYRSYMHSFSSTPHSLKRVPRFLKLLSLQCRQLSWSSEIPLWRRTQFSGRGGNQMWMLLPQVNFDVILIYKNGGKRIFEFGGRLNPPHWPPKFENPHYRAKKKVVVNFIYGYQNLSGEKCKSNGKRISSIRHTSEEKNPENHLKIPLSWNMAFLDGFLIFLFTGMSVWAISLELNSFPIGFAFFSW